MNERVALDFAKKKDFDKIIPKSLKYEWQKYVEINEDKNCLERCNHGLFQNDT